MNPSRNRKTWFASVIGIVSAVFGLLLPLGVYAQCSPWMGKVYFNEYFYGSGGGSLFDFLELYSTDSKFPTKWYANGAFRVEVYPDTGSSIGYDFTLAAASGCTIKGKTWVTYPTPLTGPNSLPTNDLLVVLKDETDKIVDALLFAGNDGKADNVYNLFSTMSGLASCSTLNDAVNAQRIALTGATALPYQTANMFVDNKAGNKDLMRTPDGGVPWSSSLYSGAGSTYTQCTSNNANFSKTTSVSLAAPGAPVTFTLKVTNTGNSSLSGVTVTDVFPNIVPTLAAPVCAPATQFTSCTASNISWTVPTLAKGISAEATITTAIPITAAAPSSITSATWTGNVATITTSAAHGLQVGHMPTISNASPSGYNGTYTITSVPTANSFTYSLPTAPGGSATLGDVAMVYTNTATTSGITPQQTDLATVTVISQSTPSFLITGPATASACSGSYAEITVTAMSALNGGGYRMDGNNGTVLYANTTTPPATVTLSTSNGTGTWKDTAGTILGTGTITYTFVSTDLGQKVFRLELTSGATITASGTDTDSFSQVMQGFSQPISFVTTDTLSLEDVDVLSPKTVAVAGRPHLMQAKIVAGCSGGTLPTATVTTRLWYVPTSQAPADAAPPKVTTATDTGCATPVTISTANPGVDNLSVAMTNGAGNFYLCTTDVGQYTLNMEIPKQTGINPALLGASPIMTTRPFGFDVSVGSTGTADPNSPIVFKKAGESFPVTVRAVRWESADDTFGGSAADGVPPVGANLSNNLSTANFGLENPPHTVTLGSTLLAPLPGDSGILTALPMSGFLSGSSSGTASWSEVGAISLTANLTGSSYIGSGANITGAASPVGRFIPDHFGLGEYKTTGTIAAGSTALTVANASGIVSGTTIKVIGAGAGGAPLLAGVSAASGANVTLLAPASTAVTDAAVYLLGTLQNRSDLSVSGSSFTYMDEPMLLTYYMTAYNLGDGKTKNYAGSFAKLNTAATATDPNRLQNSSSNWFNTGCTGTTECMGLGAFNDATTDVGLTSRLAIDTTVASPLASWTDGVGTISTHIKLKRKSSATDWPDPPNNILDGPYDNLLIGAMPRDSDGVTLPAPVATDTAHRVDFSATTGNTLASNPDATNERGYLFATQTRYGRLKLSNAYGAPQLPLAVPVEAQYYNGTNWVINTLDSSNPPAPWAVSPAIETDLAGGTGKTTPTLGAALVSGKATLSASEPGSGKYGYLDLTVTVPDYLKFPWTGGASVDPTARVTFGIYNQSGKSNKIIYRREVR